MQEYAFQFSVISSFVFLLLGLMALFTRKQVREHVSFAAFTLFLFLATISNLISGRATSLEQYEILARISYETNLLVPVGAAWFMLTLTGYSRRLSERILGIRLWYWVGMLAFTVLLFGVGLQTRWYVTDYGGRPDGRFGPFYTPLLGYTFLLFFLNMIWMTALLIRATREARHNRARLVYLHWINTGIVSVIAGAPTLGVILPMFGVEAGPFNDLLMVIVAIMFYLAINRYQLDQIFELNMGLEAKVEERTRYLHEANTRLVQSEKMAAMGRLVAGVAHELNTPLGVLKSASDTVARAGKKLRGGEKDVSDELRAKSLDVIEQESRILLDASNRIETTVQNLKRFTRLDAAEMQQVDLHEGLESALRVLEAETEDRIEVVRDYGDVPPIVCRAREINQVFLHLLQNAIEAIEGEGRIELRTKLVNGHIQVDITDNGRGIAKNRLAELFDFSFSQSNKRVKMSMGLVTSAQIVRAHGGDILVESQVGEGSTFTISLPVSHSS